MIDRLCSKGSYRPVRCQILLAPLFIEFWSLFMLNSRDLLKYIRIKTLVSIFEQSLDAQERRREVPSFYRRMAS